MRSWFLHHGLGCVGGWDPSHTGPHTIAEPPPPTYVILHRTFRHYPTRPVRLQQVTYWIWFPNTFQEPVYGPTGLPTPVALHTTHTYRTHTHRSPVLFLHTLPPPHLPFHADDASTSPVWSVHHTPHHRPTLAPAPHHTVAHKLFPVPWMNITPPCRTNSQNSAYFPLPGRFAGWVPGSTYPYIYPPGCCWR